MKKKKKNEFDDEGEGNESPATKLEGHPINLSDDELFALIQILSFSKELFTQMSLNAEKEGKDKESAVFKARTLQSDILYRRLKLIVELEDSTTPRILH
jgi:hypothetical protein